MKRTALVAVLIATGLMLVSVMYFHRSAVASASGPTLKQVATIDLPGLRANASTISLSIMTMAIFFPRTLAPGCFM